LLLLGVIIVVDHPHRAEHVMAGQAEAVNVDHQQVGLVKPPFGQVLEQLSPAAMACRLTTDLLNCPSLARNSVSSRLSFGWMTV
jgi:hypothetical protein